MTDNQRARGRGRAAPVTRRAGGRKPKARPEPGPVAPCRVCGIVQVLDWALRCQDCAAREAAGEAGRETHDETPREAAGQRGSKAP